MASNGGGVAPSLPKRPPGIGSRLSAQEDADGGDRPLPARPAPPRPPSITVSQTDEDVSPRGGPPPLPKLPPPPSKSQHARTENGSANKPSSARRRPEITVVSARPMSEIAFRGEGKTPSPGVTPTSPSVPSTGSNSQLVSPEMPKVPPPRPKSITSPMGDGPGPPGRPKPPSRPQSLGAGQEPPPDARANLIDFSAGTVTPNHPIPTPRPRPAPRSRTPVDESSTQSLAGNSNGEEKSESDRTDSSSTLSSPLKPTRPTIIRPKVTKTNQEPAESGSDAEKCSSSVLSVIQTTPANDANVNELKAAFEKRKSGALPLPPKPKPKPKPSITKKPEKLSENLVGESVANPNSGSDRQETVSVSKTVEQFGKTSDNVDEKPNFPTPPSRRKRPTIIRPGAKPNSDTVEQSEQSVISESGKICDDTLMVSRPPPPSKAPVGVQTGGPSLSIVEDQFINNGSIVQSESKPSVKSPVGRPPPPTSVSRILEQNKDKKSDSAPVRPKPVVRKPAPSVRPKSVSTDDLRSVQDKDMTKLSLPPGKTQDDSITPPPRKKRAGPPRPSQRPLSGSRSHSSLSDKDTDLSLFTRTETEKPARPPSGPPIKPGKTPPPKTTPEPVNTPEAVSSSRRVIIHEVYPQSEAPKLPPRPGPGHPLFHYVIGVPYGLAVATHDYQSMQPDELAFMEGELIVLLRRIDSSWLHGKNGEIEGMFPTGYVKIVEPLPGEGKDEADFSADSSFIEDKQKPDTGTGPRCRARFDYEGGGDDDLVFEEGEVIQILERVGDDWMRGEVRGRVGIFPLTFVEIIEDLPETSLGAAGGSSLIDMGIAPEVAHVSEHNFSSDRLIRSALFDFTGEDGELNFKTGDRIKLISRVNSDWLYGESNGHTGQFPSVFIDVIPADLPQYHSPTKETSLVDSLVDKPPTPEDHTSSQEAKTPQSEASEEEAYGIAMHEFEGGSSDDLTFKVADKILLLERVDSEWLRGRLELTGQVGVFPAAFVQIIKDLKAPSVEEKITGTPVKALYKFMGQGEKELSFEEGEIILMQEPVGAAAEWYWGELNGKKGMFPVAFIESI